ncbi:LacI family DNA-binding transcriptional regulator [Phycicoccus avicenniae]|uniref:LacI family DNA-binding transcriptional regulator n=1 Tax=Phycicoccus avicenniae TaxID=2828860 RepID=UPI00201163CC|nr:LacI family DNA-binding transcriptional regulator [Phycicoccus avicenniae]
MTANDLTQRRGRAATIADVAKLAGVATSTVSRALSNPARVNHVTRQRIEEAVGQLGYVPSAQARSLTSGRTGVVGVLVPDIANPFYFDLIRGAQRQLRAAGYAQLLLDTEESHEIESSMVELMLKNADGVVLAASRLDDETLTAAAARQPLVTINRDVPDVPTVILDTPEGMRQTVVHLRSLGHTRAVFVAGPSGSWSSARRWEALLAAGEELGVEMTMIGPWAPTAAAGSAAADAVIASSATAAVVFNDLLAIGMLGRLQERGVRVPLDLSVVGCDDIFGASFCNPPLTTVSAPIEEAGRVAVTMLLSQLGSAGGSRSRTVLPTYLTTRESSGPAPT